MAEVKSLGENFSGKAWNSSSKNYHIIKACDTSLVFNFCVAILQLGGGFCG